MNNNNIYYHKLYNNKKLDKIELWYIAYKIIINKFLIS